jgi:hypothetical protein
MTCKKIRKILYTERIDELDAPSRKDVERHISACTACSDVLKNVLRADAVIAGIRDAVPTIENPKKLTASIITAITKTPGFQHSESVTGVGRLLDHLATFFSKPAVRFACSFVLLACGLSYTILEYNDTKAIALLEHKLGRGPEYSTIDARSLTEQEIIVQLASDLYKFAQNNLSYEALVDRLGLIGKEDRDVLMDKYRNLDEPVRARLDKLQSHFLAENGTNLHAPRKAEEVHALRQDIWEFRKALIPYIGKDGRP